MFLLIGGIDLSGISRFSSLILMFVHFFFDKFSFIIKFSLYHRFIIIIGFLSRFTRSILKISFKHISITPNFFPFPSYFTIFPVSFKHISITPSIFPFPIFATIFPVSFKHISITPNLFPFPIS